MMQHDLETHDEGRHSPPVESTPNGKSHHYPALDGIRGIAILAVFFTHFGGGHKSTNALIHLWSVIADAGWMGVDLFFVLSGFLITGILFDTAHRPNRVKNFYARRALRIFPLFYGVLFGLLLFTPILHLHWQLGDLLYFFYLSNMIPVFAPHLPWLGPHIDLSHFWSLAVEEQFYLIWPWVVWNVCDRIKLIRISVVIMIAALVLRVILVVQGIDPFIVYSLLPTRADSLVCGGALSLLVRGPAAGKLPVGWALPISSVAVLALFLIGGNGHYDSPVMLTVGFSAIAVLCACIVYCAQQGRGWIAHAGKNNLLRFFGRYSYGLYVYHGLLVVIALPMVYPIQAFARSVLLGGIIYILLSLGLSLTIAILSYKLFEAPILALKSRFE